MSYTLSKAEDMSTDSITERPQIEYQGMGRNPADPTGLPLGFDALAEKGPPIHDQRHRLVLSGIYVLPQDIQVSAIVAVASGRPFNPLAGIDLNGDGNFFDRPRTDPTDPQTSVGRNSGTITNQVTVDVRLSKRFKVGGTATVEGLVEIFNLFNRTNFSEVNNVFGPGAFPGAPVEDASGRSTYGRFVQTLAPRQIQLAMRLRF